MNAPIRKLVTVPFQGSDYECVPGPALIAAVEARPDGLPMREAVQSLRLTDHAWVLYCALLPVAKGVTRDGVLEVVLKDPITYERASLDLCLETLSPEAARAIEEREADENEPPLPGIWETGD